MLEVFEPGALNYSTFSHPILSTLSASRNPISTHLPLSGFLGSLLCILIVPTPGLAFTLVIPRMLAAALSSSSDRTYFSLNFLPPLFTWSLLWLCRDQHLSKQLLLGVFSQCVRPPICSSPTDGRTDSFSPSILSFSRNLFNSWGLQLPSPPLGLKSHFQPLQGRSIRLGHLFWPPPPQWPWHTHPSPSLLSFAPFSLALSCSWEVLQDLGSDHLPILLSIPLSPAFRPNERSPSFNFQKACWDGFASYIDSHCPFAEEYSSLSLFSAAALFISLALNAVKSSISFVRIKRPPKVSWSAEVEEAVSERRKAFAAAHRSDEDRQVYISASRCASSVIAKVKTGIFWNLMPFPFPARSVYTWSKSVPFSVHFRWVNKPRPGSRTILSTIDFSVAFDSVWHPALSTNSFRLASLLALLVGLNLSFLIGALLWSFKITKVIPFEFVEVFCKDLFLALYFSLSSLMIFLLLCFLPSAALFMLTIWLFGPPPPWSPLRWRPHKELCFDWSAVLSTGVFLSIRAIVRPLLSHWIPTKLTSSPTSSYLAPASVSIPLRLFLWSPSTALFRFLSMYLRWRPSFSNVSRPLHCISASSWGPSKESLSFLYKSFLRPVFTHASPGWFPFLSATNFTKL